MDQPQPPNPLQALRASVGWKQADTADRLGMSRLTYSAYETGVRPCPADVVVRVADLYSLSPERVEELVRWSASVRTTTTAARAEARL